jgi:aspartate racemase
MRTIGLIGGMSFESTAIYYRMINEMVRERLGPDHSARVLMHSVDFADIIACQKENRWDDAAAILAHSAKSLENAGADNILICTNTMHLVADQIRSATKAPLIHIIDETAAALNEAGMKRPLLVATRYTMDHGFYHQRMARAGLELMVPEESDRGRVHDIIFSELCRGKVEDGSRHQLMEIVERAKLAGADSVILGCTEICLILDPDALSLPGFDSTAIHARAAVKHALAA